MRPLRPMQPSRRARSAIAVAAGCLALASAGAVPAGAAGIVVKPGSNFLPGQGTYPVTVSGAKGSVVSVPDPAAVPSIRTATTKVGSAALVGAAGTFTPSDVGRFVDDGVGGRLGDGVPVTALTPEVAVYPRQGIPSVKSVNASGTTATLTQKALGAGTGTVNVIASSLPIVLVTQSSGSVPFVSPIPNGLCLLPAFPGGVCPYTAGNLAHDATKQYFLANADGSFSIPFTLVEGVMDGGIGRTDPGPVFVKIFDPDGAAPEAPYAPFAVPRSTPGAAPIGCAPGLADRSIPNPAIGGVDYCMVTAIVLNSGVQATFVPYQLRQFPITWAAAASGFVAGNDLVIAGHDFANGDVLAKVTLSNAKAKQTANPTLKCVALNRTITGEVATATGDVLIGVADFDAGCTVPPTSVTKVTIMGSKDFQRSQIPPNDVIGANLAKKATTSVVMAAP
jgi:hypothetical protein